MTDLTNSASSTASTSTASVSITTPGSVPLPPGNNTSSSGSTMDSLEAANYHREWIIECIDKLRDRKARPDVDRIAVLMKRQHNVSQSDTVKCLAKLADLAQVISVDYKGNISYRNPRKWRKCGSSCVLNPPAISNVILETLQLLDSQRRSVNPTCTDMSFSTAEIEAALQGKCPLMGHRLEVVLDRECAYGCLSRRGENRFVLDDEREKKKALMGSRKLPSIQSSKSASLSTMAAQKHSLAAKSAGMLARNSSAISKDGLSQTPGYSLSANAPLLMPNMNMFPNHSATSGLARAFLLPAPPMQQSPSSSAGNNDSGLGRLSATNSQRRPRPYSATTSIQPKRTAYGAGHATRDFTGKLSKMEMDSNGDLLLSSGKSSLLNSSMHCNNQGMMEVRCSECNEGSSTDKKIYSCSTCAIKAHLGCLGFWVSEPMEPATWQCPKCIVCRICHKRDIADRLLVCATCTRAYHALCHKPHVDENIEIFQPWVCEPCDSQGFYFIPPGQSDLQSSQGGNSPSQLMGSTGGGPGEITGETSSLFEERKMEMDDSIPSAAVLPAVSDELEVTTSVNSHNLKSEDSASISSVSAMRPSASPGHQQSSQKYPTSASPRPASSNGCNKKLSSSIYESEPKESAVAAWTVQEVVGWLDYNGFTRESRLFLEQEIDGPSLLLVRQIELLAQLGLKLGPAVKILQLLKKIKVDSEEVAS